MATEVSEQQQALQKLIDQYRGSDGALIPVLQEAQNIYGYLPKDVMEIIAKELNIPFSRVYGVATFYAQFHLNQRGRNIIRVCLGTACHVRGGSVLYEAIKEKLGIDGGQTTEDLRFTLETVACIGACGLSPCMMVNDDTHGRLKPEDIDAILERYQ